MSKVSCDSSEKAPQGAFENGAENCCLQHKTGKQIYFPHSRSVCKIITLSETVAYYSLSPVQSP